MTDDITLHHNAIADMFADTDGLKAYRLVPAKLDTSDLPAIYTLTGNADYSESELGENFEDVKRIYRVQVAVLPLGQADPEKRETLCRTWLEICTTVIHNHPGLLNVAGVQKSKLLSDSGVVVLREYGLNYVGFEMRLQVEYVRERQFASGE